MFGKYKIVQVFGIPLRRKREKNKNKDWTELKIGLETASINQLEDFCNRVI